ncbi:polysaccharide biosynthesis tyrosine autokinase [Tamlana agarivorans]|uniref:Polysaccharide biosynthesis tyrosine autokinase n=1 Tax=Pseudotamlana agarivorans TaxID=481183 RepID=A0ACC5U7I0_9FLAO|nr:polysaccharide biosynthesis tyrosine autokinase [Tamlana agarivorans]MBU2950255.1 polysaccharide biosynthesis tyrosine autokinase [Tamlana agarivorans]
MQNQEIPPNMIIAEEETTNIRQEIEKYAIHWKWFVLSIILAGIGAFLYLRYTPNLYEVATTILIEDDAKGASPELAVFEELGIGGNQKNIANEITILESRSLINKVGENLKLNIAYFKDGNIRSTEQLKNELPFNINFLTADSFLFDFSTAFKINIVSDTAFEISNLENENKEQHSFGSPIDYNGLKLIITPKTIKNTDETFTVSISPLKQVVQGLRNQIQVTLLNPNASVIELKMQSRKKAKAQLILDELVRQYNKDAVEYKNLIGNNTDAFIKERLALIEQDLIQVDKNAETFKTENKLTDINTETGIVLATNSEIEKQIIELNTQLKLVAYVKAHLKDNQNTLIPESLGLSDSNINTSSSQYNELLLERNRISKSTGGKNPVIINLDTQLNQIRESIVQGLDNLKSSLKISLNDAIVQEQRMASRISTAPKREREFRDIQRQQQIIETLYLFLLQKREENAISLAVTAPNAKLVDAAEGAAHPVGPNRKMIYLTAILLGLAIPFGIIFIVDLLDNKVHTQKELEETIKAPFMGAIPTTSKKDRMLVKGDRGSLAEAFRMVRTNLNFMLGNTEVSGKAIFVTSTLPGEGKTFVTINLATVFAMTDKKVLLIGADIRKPKVVEYLDISATHKGLTEYLADKTVTFKDIIEPQERGFDLIQSGIIAPNPAELLMNGRLDELLAYSKQHYDVVIVDTAPVTLVTDTIQIAPKADLFLYITRANYLDKRLLDVPKQLYNEKRLPNMSLVMNGTDPKKGYGYGYGGYGYGNDEEKTPWWRFNK